MLPWHPVAMFGIEPPPVEKTNTTEADEVARVTAEKLNAITEARLRKRKAKR